MVGSINLPAMPDIVKTSRKLLNWRGWIRGLGKGVISGGASAVVSFFGLAGADAMHIAKAIDMRQAAGIFVSGALIHAMLYLQAQPLPEEIDGTAAPIVPLSQ